MNFKNLIAPFGVFIISRLFFIGLILLFRIIYPHDAYTPENLHLNNFFVDIFCLYDSFHYHDIALNGYSNENLTAFFPLFPLLISLLHNITGFDVFAIGVFFSNICFLLSLIILNQLMLLKNLNYIGRLVTLLFIAFLPSSYYFSAFYTESFFLLLSLLAFYLYKKDYRLLAYIIGGLASLTRLAGCAIPIAFFVSDILKNATRIKAILYSSISFLLFLAYPFYLYITKGNAFIFLQVQENYGRHTTFPFKALAMDAVLVIFSFISLNAAQFTLIAFHFVLVYFLYKYFKNFIKNKDYIKENLTEFIFTLIIIIIPLCSILETSQLYYSHGFMRYILPAFPLFIFVGLKLSSLYEKDKKSKLKVIILGLYLLLLGADIIKAIAFKYFMA